MGVCVTLKLGQVIGRPGGRVAGKELHSEAMGGQKLEEGLAAFTVTAF